MANQDQRQKIEAIAKQCASRIAEITEANFKTVAPSICENLLRTILVRLAHMREDIQYVPNNQGWVEKTVERNITHIYQYSKALLLQSTQWPEYGEELRRHLNNLCEDYKDLFGFEFQQLEADIVLGVNREQHLR